MSNINTSFSYIIAPDNDYVALPECIHKTLKLLFNNGYLSIKPLEVTSRYVKNGNNEDVYNISMSFDDEDKALFEYNCPKVFIDN
ncbi:unnamed protein product [marine sediment metagenome]|uniref:Uncharacterized protein n=1 Tax=marine sediment metagenome TaxID=412755 RepID=X0WQN3_9ZZZZ